MLYFINGFTSKTYKFEIYGIFLLQRGTISEVHNLILKD